VPNWSPHERPRRPHLAQQLHAGQVDKAGKPYVGHLARVQSRLHDQPDHIQIAAALHDSIEVQGLTATALMAHGVPPESIRIVEMLSKPAGGDYGAYLSVVAADDGARLLKLADVADNSCPLRLAALPAEMRAKLRAKYNAALDILLA
jgi:hypothetical protein